MLKELFEGTNKCTNYFPTNVGQTLEFGASAEIKVTAKKADFVSKATGRLETRTMFQHKFSIDTKVKIMVTQLEVQISDKTMNTVHYHWQDWPDRGVPEADMAPILLLQHLEKEYLVYLSSLIIMFVDQKGRQSLFIVQQESEERDPLC